MPMYRKKPVVVEALQLRWDTWQEVCAFVGVGPRSDQPRRCYVDAVGNATETGTDEIGLQIPTLEGLMLARQGDYVIRGVKGEFYPCKPDIFAATYEPV